MANKRCMEKECKKVGVTVREDGKLVCDKHYCRCNYNPPTGFYSGCHLHK